MNPQNDVPRSKVPYPHRMLRRGKGRYHLFHSPNDPDAYLPQIARQGVVLLAWGWGARFHHIRGIYNMPRLPRATDDRGHFPILRLLDSRSAQNPKMRGAAKSDRNRALLPHLCQGKYHREYIAPTPSPNQNKKPTFLTHMQIERKDAPSRESCPRSIRDGRTKEGFFSKCRHIAG